MESQMSSTSCSLNPKQAQSLFTVLLNLQASCEVRLILTGTSPTHSGKKKKKKIRVIFSVTQWKANFSLARQLLLLEIKMQTAHMPRPPVAGSPAQGVTQSMANTCRSWNNMDSFHQVREGRGPDLLELQSPNSEKGLICQPQNLKRKKEQ